METMNIANKAMTNNEEKKSILKNQEDVYKILKIVSILGFFVVWQLISTINQSVKWFNPVFLPSPIMVLKTAYIMLQKGLLIKHLTASLIRILIGFGAGALSAVLVGIVLSRSQTLESLIQPVLNMIGPIPPFAFLPMFIIWFGVGEMPKYLLIAYAAFFPILTYTIDGIKNVNPLLIRSALSLGANQFQIFTKVILKSALPNIFVGMKVSLALTFSALVVAEMMGADSGLGYIIVDARNWFKLSDMMLAAALIGIEYTIFYSIITAIEKILFKWKKGGMRDAIES